MLLLMNHFIFYESTVYLKVTRKRLESFAAVSLTKISMFLSQSIPVKMEEEEGADHHFSVVAAGKAIKNNNSFINGGRYS